MMTFGNDSFSEDNTFSCLPDDSENQQATFGYTSFGEETTFNQGE